jgi:glycerate 2-kinase
MCHFGQKIKEFLDIDVTMLPGAGAAGGMGAGLIGFLNAEKNSGFKIIKDVVKLEDIIQKEKFDYIFTGEGQMNHQTSHGKLPFGMMGLGKKYGIPVISIAGSLSDGYETMFRDGLTAALLK